MKPDDIYKVLLELKEGQGETNAKLEDIRDSISKQSDKHDKLEDKHNNLQRSHDNVKTKVGFFSFTFGTISGALTAWATKYLS